MERDGDVFADSTEYSNNVSVVDDDAVTVREERERGEERRERREERGGRGGGREEGEEEGERREREGERRERERERRERRRGREGEQLMKLLFNILLPDTAK